MDLEKLTEAIKDSVSVAETLKKMNLNISTGNYRTFHKYVKKYNLDTSHFLGQSHLKDSNRNISTTRSLEEILVQDSDYSSIYSLKKRLIRNNVLKYECSECKISSWNGKPISLQLDHINGIHNDHRLCNLRFLCPNCHSQTDTFAGKNKKKN